MSKSVYIIFNKKNIQLVSTDFADCPLPRSEKLKRVMM